MSETIQTKGWSGPKGLCDMCRKKPAAFWFGDTSVALCGDVECDERNRYNWRKMLSEMEEEEERKHGW
jgi:hypothetical protein